MASEALPAKYLKAGEDYLAALRQLGLAPEFLGWGQDQSTSDWLLVLVTPAVEIGGPLAMARLLFQAYNLKATPRQISPFIVQVFGSKTLYAPKLRMYENLRRSGGQLRSYDRVTGELKASGTGFMTSIIGGIKISSADCYVLNPRSPSREQKTNEWNRFRRNVERLAA